jgi:hypothetical protein
MFDFFGKSLASTRRRQAGLIAGGGIAILCLGVIATIAVYQLAHPIPKLKWFRITWPKLQMSTFSSLA